MAETGSRRYTLRTLALEVVMISVAAIFTFPLYVLIVLAFKSPTEWLTTPLSLPLDPYFGNFEAAWGRGRIGGAILASITVLCGSLTVLVMIGSTAAYFIARCGEKLGGALYFFFLAGLVLPFQLALIPLYQLMRDLSLLGSPVSLIL